MTETLEVALTVVSASDVARISPASHQVHSFYVVVNLDGDEPRKTIVSTGAGSMVWDHTFHFAAHRAAKVCFRLYRLLQARHENSVIGGVSITLQELLEKSTSVDNTNISIPMESCEHTGTIGRLIVRVIQNSQNISGLASSHDSSAITTSEAQASSSSTTAENVRVASPADNFNVIFANSLFGKPLRCVRSPGSYGLRIPLDHLIKAIFARFKRRKHPSLPWESDSRPLNPFQDKLSEDRQRQPSYIGDAPDVPTEDCPPYYPQKQTARLSRDIKLTLDCSISTSESSSSCGPSTPPEPNDTGECQLVTSLNSSRDYVSVTSQSDLHDSPSFLRRGEISEEYDSLLDLGNSNHDRYSTKGDLEDLDQTIHYYERALSLSLPGLPDHSASLNRLSGLFWERFQKRGHFLDLQRALEIYSDALELCLMEHADSTQQLMMSQAVDLVKRFQSEGNFSDLQRAMELHDNARRQCPDNDAPDRQSGHL